MIIEAWSWQLLVSSVIEVVTVSLGLSLLPTLSPALSWIVIVMDPWAEREVNEAHKCGPISSGMPLALSFSPVYINARDAQPAKATITTTTYICNIYTHVCVYKNNNNFPAFPSLLPFSFAAFYLEMRYPMGPMGSDYHLTVYLARGWDSVSLCVCACVLTFLFLWHFLRKLNTNRSETETETESESRP